RMNAMTSRIEVPPDNAAALATFQCDDPHRIIGFAHLTKRELPAARSRGRPLSLRALSRPAALSTARRRRRRCRSAGQRNALALTTFLRGFRTQSCAGMLLWPRRYDRLGLPM